MRKLTGVLFILLLLPAFCFGSWEQFQKDEAHTANICDTGIKAPLCIKWRAKLGTIYHGSAPVGAGDGTFYVHDSSSIYRFNTSNGDLIFRKNLPASAANTNLIIYSDKVILLGSYSIMAFDRVKGTVMYNVSMGLGSSNCFCSGVSSYYVNDPIPALHNGKIYAGTKDGYIFVINADTGAFIKKAKIAAAGVLAAPSFDADGMMYFGANDNYFYAVDGETLAIKWKQYMASPVYGTASVDGNGVYFASQIGKVYGLNKLTGAIKWSYLTGSWMNSSGSIHNGNFIIGSDDRYVYCLNTLTGALVWRSVFLIDNFAKMSCITICNEVFITGCVDRLVMLNADTGATDFTCHSTASNFSSPAYIDGRIAFVSNDYYLYVMGECGNCPCSCDATMMPTEAEIRTAVPAYTATFTATETFTGTFTQTATDTFTPTPTFTGTFTQTSTDTYTATSTFTPTATVTPSFTATATPTATSTCTDTITPTYTRTPTAVDTVDPCIASAAPKFSVKMVLDPETGNNDFFEIASTEQLSSPPILTVYPHGNTCGSKKETLTFTAVLIPGSANKYAVLYPKQTGFGDIDRVVVTGKSACGREGKYDGGFDKEVISKKDVVIFKNVINPDEGERARITYKVNDGTNVKINVYTRKGAIVRTLFDGKAALKGNCEAVWDGKDASGKTVSSGIYMIIVETDLYTVREKVAVTR